MKKLVLLLTAFSLIVHGDETAPAPEETAPETQEAPSAAYATTKTEENQEEETPSAAYASTQAAKSSGDWKNWVFAGSAAVVFTVAVLIVTLNTGAPQSGH